MSVPARAAWRDHLPEYASEALGLALFMCSACAFGVWLEYPGSPLHAMLPDADVRRALMGAAMGLTAVALVHSPWGKRSGAHLNPATTLAFWRLGRVRAADLAGYVLAQFAGAGLGVGVMAAVLGRALADPRVHYVVTRPGPAGPAAAFAAEFLIALALMSVVLRVSAHPRAQRWTGAIAGLLVALFIYFAAPVCGTSMNPARTFGSALIAGDWTAWWVYAFAPPLAMLAAAEALLVEAAWRGRAAGGCAKLDHAPDVRCIFCGYTPSRANARRPGTSAASATLGAIRQP